jgi:hypothetical protein
MVMPVLLKDLKIIFLKVLVYTDADYAEAKKKKLVLI